MDATANDVPSPYEVKGYVDEKVFVFRYGIYLVA